MTNTGSSRSDVDSAAVARSAVPAQTGWTGWVRFAAFMLMMNGFIQALEGLMGLVNEDYYTKATADLPVSLSYGVWGWVHLLLGILTAAAGAGLFFGKTWARTLAVIAAAASMVGSFAWLPHYPIWGIVIIALDVFVMWAAIVHGRALVEE